MGAAFVGRFWIVVLAVAFLAAAVLDLICVLQLWPATSSSKSGSSAIAASAVHSVLGIRGSISADVNLLLIAVFVGALGGLLHSLRSLSSYVGERQLRWSWVLFYLLLPAVGAMLSLIFYLLVRGGLISPEGSGTDLNPYGIAAISALVGLFTGQAAEMLKSVFSTLFAKAKSGTDTLSSESGTGAQ